MLSFFLIKTDAHRNHDDGVPAHVAKLAHYWIATNCSLFISKYNDLWTTMPEELCFERYISTPAGKHR